MHRDDQILEYISKKQEISQRELAKYTGLSLGSINMIIQQMVEKGLVKVEKVKPNTLRYVLTPEGVTENTLKTYRYILHSVKHVLRLKRELEQIVERYTELGYGVYLYGEKDEIREILRQLSTEGQLRRVRWMESGEEIGEVGEKRLVVVWQMEREKELVGYNCDWVNILDRVGS